MRTAACVTLSIGLAATLAASPGRSKSKGPASDRQGLGQEPTRKTIAHRVMQLESELGGVKPNYALLDSIIDEIRTKIKLKPRYSRSDAIGILRTIDKTLIERNFIYGGNVLSLCEAMTPREAMKTELQGISRADVRRRAVARARERFYRHDCVTFSWIYMAIAEPLALPVNLVEAPKHLFIRWNHADGTYDNWDPTDGRNHPDSFYVNGTGISRDSMRAGVYLRTLDAKETKGKAHLFRGVGRVLLRRDHAGGLGDYDVAVSLNPLDLTAYQNRAKALIRLDKYNQAMADVDKALSLGGWCTRGCSSANRRRHVKRPDKAAGTSEGASRSSVIHNELHYDRGIIWNRKKRRNKAMLEFARAIELNPRMAMAYWQRGLVCSRRGQLRKAMADYDKALLLDPRLAGAYVHRGNVWYVKKKYEKAISDFTKAIKLDGEEWSAYFSRGLAWQQKGNHKKAIDDFTKTIKLKPEHSEAWMRRASSYSTSKDLRSAIRDLTSASRLNPSDMGIYRRRGAVRYLAGQYESALKDMNLWLTSSPSDGPGYMVRALIHRKLGQEKRAKADFAAAKKYTGRKR